MPESVTPEDIKTTKDWFASKIDYMKQAQVVFRTHFEAAPEKGKYPTFKAYTLALSEIYRQFLDIYEVLNGIIGQLYTLTTEADSRNLKMRKEIKKMKEKFEEHEPTLQKLEEAFNQTERVMDENR